LSLNVPDLRPGTRRIADFVRMIAVAVAVACDAQVE
jgi:hypothetical protein